MARFTSKSLHLWLPSIYPTRWDGGGNVPGLLRLIRVPLKGREATCYSLHKYATPASLILLQRCLFTTPHSPQPNSYRTFLPSTASNSILAPWLIIIFLTCICFFKKGYYNLLKLSGDSGTEFLLAPLCSTWWKANVVGRMWTTIHNYLLISLVTTGAFWPYSLKCANLDF